jgi:hypothetical protein
MKTLEPVEFEDEVDWNGLHRGYASTALGAWKTVHAKQRRVELVLARSSPATADLEAEFEALARRWERETAVESFPHRKAMHPAYQEIIAFGPRAIPLLLRRLERRPGHWFWALRALTRDDPAADSDDPRSARAAWLEWGRQHGYLA